MSTETTREWVVEHNWICGNHPCNTVNLFRNDKCSGCGQSKGANHKEIVPTDMSYENRVTDTTRYDDDQPDWLCSYCVGHTRNPAVATSCLECGSPKGEKRSDVASGEDTTAGGMVLDATPPASKKWVTPANLDKMPSDCSDHPRMVDPEIEDRRNAILTHEFLYESVRAENQKVPQVSTPVVTPGVHYRDIKVQTTNKVDFAPTTLSSSVADWFAENGKALGVAFGGLTVLAAIIYGCFWLFSWHSTVATVSETRWNYHVDLHQRVVRHGNDWRDNEPAHAFNETCHREIRSYHRCDPYRCNPHSVSYDCHCRSVTTCRPVTRCRTSCSRSGNGSSRCRESCSTSESCRSRSVCQTCYRTEYDTCWNRCPDYDDKCDFDYPTWPVAQVADTTNTDHTLVRPNLTAPNNVVCAGDPELLYLANRSVVMCTVDSVRYHATFNAGEHGRHEVTPQSLAEYNRYHVGARWNAEYNHAGMFRVLNPR